MEALDPFFTLPPSMGEGVISISNPIRPQSPLSLQNKERRVLTAFCDRHLNVGRWEKLVCDCTERQMRLEGTSEKLEMVSCFEERGSAWGHLGKWDKAVSDFTNALELVPNHPRLLAARANAQCMLQRWRDAVNDCTQAIRSSPTLYKTKTSHRQFCADVFGNRSAALRMLGLLEKSVEDCSQALSMIESSSKTFPFHLKNRYITNRSLGRWQLVVNDLDLLIRLDPMDAQLWIARGVALGKIGQKVGQKTALQDAKRSFDAALQLEPNNASALLNRAVAHAALRDWKESLEDCESCLLDKEYCEKSVMLWRTMAHAKSQLGQLEAATKDFTVALSLAPGDWSLLLNRATANGRLSEWTQVISDTSVILSAFEGEEDISLQGPRREQFIMALTHRISAARALKKFQEALKDCERLISCAFSQDAQVSALASRALVYSELKRWEDAIGDCDAATLLSSSPFVDNASGGVSDKGTDPTKATASVSMDQNLKKLGRLKEWIIVQKEQELKEATERADRMAKLLIAEENSNLWNEAYVTAVSSSRNSKKKQRKLRKKRSKKVGEAAEVEDEDEDEDEDEESDEKIRLENNTDLLKEAQDKEAGEEETRVNKLSGSMESLTVSKPPSTQDGIEEEGGGSGRDPMELPPLSPSSVKPPQPPLVEASPRTVYEKIFRSVKMLEKTLSDATKIAKESAIKTASKTSSLSTVKEDRMADFDQDVVEGGGESLYPRKLFSSEGNKNNFEDKTQPSSNKNIEKSCDLEQYNSKKRIGKLQWDESEVLGKGSFGTVVMSGCHDDWGEVAVKSMMRGNLNDHDPEQGRVLELSATAEREIMSVMSRSSAHENVVRYFGVEEDDQRVFLAIERCAYSLHDLYFQERLRQTRQLIQGSRIKLVKLVGELMSALEFLHNKGVVHGDLRPRNVLFLSDGVLKLSDFGLARQVSDEEDASFTWAHSSPSGLGGWFAPEVCRKQRKTKAVDIFSAGCVVYFALTKGQHPFNGSAFDVIDQNSNFEHLADDMEALSLVKLMVANEASARPAVGAVLVHPFLWPSHKRLAYLEEIGNKLDRFKEKLENIPMSFDWTLRIDPRLYSSMTRFRSYSNSMCDLIRFIRNLNQHFTDQEEEAVEVLLEGMRTSSNRFGDSDIQELSLDKVLNSTALQRDAIECYFFTQLFPGLIIDIWNQAGTAV